MYTINEPIENYKSCIKQLWEGYYMKLPDGEHDFEGIRRLIWETLVVKFLYDTIEGVADGQIVIKGKHIHSKVLIAEPSAIERSVSWQYSDRMIAGQVFIFEDFFDFRQLGERHALDYVLCHPDGTSTERLLIPTQDVDFCYRERPSSRALTETATTN